MKSLTRICFIGLSTFTLAISAQAEPSTEAAAGAEHPVVQSEAGTAACGHVGEILAAQEALRADDRAEALWHLKKARRILSRCEAQIPEEKNRTAALEI